MGGGTCKEAGEKDGPCDVGVRDACRRWRAGHNVELTRGWVWVEGDTSTAQSVPLALPRSNALSVSAPQWRSAIARALRRLQPRLFDRTSVGSVVGCVRGQPPSRKARCATPRSPFDGRGCFLGVRLADFPPLSHPLPSQKDGMRCWQLLTRPPHARFTSSPSVGTLLG